MPRDIESLFDPSVKRDAPSQEKVLWSTHAVKKAWEAGFRTEHVEQALRKCSVIEDYHAWGRTLADCLVLSFINSEPVHMIIAIDPDFDRIVLVTLYRPSTERWEHDWKTRKK